MSSSPCGPWPFTKKRAGSTFLISFPLMPCPPFPPSHPPSLLPWQLRHIGRRLHGGRGGGDDHENRREHQAEQGLLATDLDRPSPAQSHPDRGNGRHRELPNCPFGVFDGEERGSACPSLGGAGGRCGGGGGGGGREGGRGSGGGSSTS
ncbi:hypothetical protein Naga_100329g6 [Nannochloropsis gaditana]|uniref:Uncharacterized protein n=1 Tax=Nannochloropsis gaditana TaxID=72520 RepID=W7U694_9STRA|nr:hypothetical protein Naga_100329g6 [Nannochloropsis gaditana]